MNKDVYDRFNGLGSNHQSELRHHFRNSDLMLKLISFLEKDLVTANFKNREVVEYLYETELKAEEYSILENRYFKLRKKLVDYIGSLNQPSEEQFTEEEQELNQIRVLLGEGKTVQAYPRLVELEKKCWENNIFEILPQVIDLMVRCNQGLNKLKQNEALYKRATLANALLKEIQDALVLVRKLYDFNFRNNGKQVDKIYLELKRFASIHKEYPRFAFAYHVAALYYKSGSGRYLDKRQVISRHFHELERLVNKHPHIPASFYQPNYRLHQHYRLIMMKAYYYYNNCQFQESYACFMEVWEMVHAGNSIFRFNRNEVLFMNKLRAEVSLGRYKDAYHTGEELLKFLKENNNSQHYPAAWSEMANVYSNAFPDVKYMNRQMLMDKLNEYSRILKHEEGAEHPEAVYALRGKLHFLEKEYKEALVLWNKPEVQNYYSNKRVLELYLSLFKLPLQEGFEDKTRREQLLSDFEKKLAKLLYQNRSAHDYLDLRWISDKLKLLRPGK